MRNGGGAKARCTVKKTWHKKKKGKRKEAHVRQRAAKETVNELCEKKAYGGSGLGGSSSSAGEEAGFSNRGLRRPSVESVSCEGAVGLSKQ